MATNEFKLAQTTTQLQDLLNLLTANPLSSGYTLVTNGDKGVQFKRSVHSGDTFIAVDGDNAITLNTAALRPALNIPSTDDFEKVTNRVTIISNASTDVQYPSAKAVYNLLNNIGLNISTAETVAQIKEQFTSKRLVSNTLYIANIAINSKLVPCIFLQSGNIQLSGANVGLMILYEDKWTYISGVTTPDTVTVSSENDNTYQISSLATKSYVDELITGTLNKEY